MKKIIFDINGKKYLFNREKFDYTLIIEKDRNFVPSIIKVEKEERNSNNDELYVVTSKIYIDDFFVKSNFKKLEELSIIKEIK